MGVSRRVGAGTGSGCSRQTQNPDGPCQQPVSWASGSNRSPGSLGRDLLLWSCRHLRELRLSFFFLQPISQFPEEEDTVSEASLIQNKCLLPGRHSAPACPTGSGGCQNAQTAWPESWYTGVADQHLASQPPRTGFWCARSWGVGGGKSLGTGLSCKALKALATRTLTFQVPRRPKVAR